MGPQEGRPPGNACVWVVATLLLFIVLAGGACLVLYISLPPSDVPHWLPIAGLVLVAFPWVFWILTCLYRCVGVRAPAVESQPSRPATVAPSASSKSNRSAASGSGAGGRTGNGSAKHDHSPVDSPGGARRVHFGNATVVGSNDSGEGAAADEDSQHGNGKATLSRDSSSMNSHESEVPLAYSMS